LKSVVFDVGNVLLDWDARRIFEDVFDTRSEIESFLSEINFTEWNSNLDKSGTYDGATKELTSKHPHHSEKIRMLDTHWMKSLNGSIDTSVRVLESLKAANIPLYAITNFSAEKWIVACGHFPFLQSSFIDVVVSAHEGLLKPDPAIFELFLNRNNLASRDCIFIDDSQENIISAKNLGFDAIHFHKDISLGSELSARGVNFQ